jgi:hypothetical protein
MCLKVLELKVNQFKNKARFIQMKIEKVIRLLESKDFEQYQIRKMMMMNVMV